ncbi:LCP family protein [Cohnella sp. WQ 127256]|uniref:LCP family glycopolymer transferase n=1 Tax=Cohnella sp. WQ 127256 TaxID=2938790 RepID=UPI002117D421
MKRALVIKIIVYSLISLFVIAILSGGYLWYSMQKTMDAMYEPLPSTKWVNPVFEIEPEAEKMDTPVTTDIDSNNEGRLGPEVSVVAPMDEKSRLSLDEEGVKRLRNPNLSEEDPFSILLLGVDERAGDRGRSDTMILMTIEPKKGEVVAISIPRDTRTLMPNSGKYDKINHSYAFGGSSLAVEAVEHLFGVPISYYMKTNMEGLVNIVDTLDGVDVVNQRAFEYEGRSFPLGAQHLDGEEALAYSRMRKEDPQGDFGRTQRQRQVLSSAVDQVISVNSITKLPRLLSHLSDYVRTNLTSKDMINLAIKYRPVIHNIETLYLEGKGKMINGIYYYTVTPAERQRIQSRMLMDS